MEGNQEQLSVDDYDLTYWAWLDQEGRGELLSSLYPKLPEGYFEGKPSPLTPNWWKPRPQVTPRVAIVDLNAGDDGRNEERKRKPAVEIGVNVSF